MPTRDHYLNVLGLTDGATKSQIKSAYRRLAKKYHPDVASETEAHESFLAIKDAYLRLYNTHSTNWQHTSPPTTRPTQPPRPKATPYTQRRKSQQKQGRKYARETTLEQIRVAEKFLRFFDIAAKIYLAFNILLVVDFILPGIHHQQQIVRYESNIDNYPNASIKVEFEDYRTRLIDISDYAMQNYEQATVVASPIFNKLQYVEIVIDKTPFRYEQGYNLSILYLYMTPIVFFALFCYLRLSKHWNTRISFSIFILFLWLIQWSSFGS